MEAYLFTIIISILGAVCIFRSLAFTVMVLMNLFIFGAAGTIALGSASIPPANLFLLFYCCRILPLPGALRLMLDALRPGRSGFTLVLLVTYAVLTAYFYPRLLGQLTEVFYSDRTVSESVVTLARPLEPGSGNITQSIYALSEICVYLTTYAYFRFGAGKAFLFGFRMLAIMNIVFAILDIVTYSFGRSDLLAIIRSGGYIVHLDQDWAGYRRIIGSFPEPSSFGAFSFQMFVCMFCLWYLGREGRLVTFAMFGNLVLALISTSTTAYFAVATFVAILLLWFLKAAITMIWPKKLKTVAIFLLAISLVIWVMIFFDLIPQGIYDIFYLTLNKSESQSAIERTMMNNQAWLNFVDTYGSGVGLGSARASNFVIVVLSNLGGVGFALFVLFMYQLLKPSGMAFNSDSEAVTSVARGAILSGLLLACISGGVYDLGALFYVACGLLAAARESGVRQPRGFEGQLPQPTIV